MLHFIMSTRNLSRFALALLLFVATLNVAFAQELSPAITVQPDTHVEVGEEVYFSATGTTYSDPAILGKARYEWDFGDGYAFKFGYPLSTSSYSGIAVIHYFMKPGN